MSDRSELQLGSSISAAAPIVSASFTVGMAALTRDCSEIKSVLEFGDPNCSDEPVGVIPDCLPSTEVSPCPCAKVELSSSPTNEQGRTSAPTWSSPSLEAGLFGVDVAAAFTTFCTMPGLIPSSSFLVVLSFAATVLSKEPLLKRSSTLGSLRGIELLGSVSVFFCFLLCSLSNW